MGSSACAFVPRFFQKTNRGDPLAFRYHFLSIRLWKGLVPQSSNIPGTARKNPPDARRVEGERIRKLEPDGSSEDESAAGGDRESNHAGNVITDRGIAKAEERRSGRAAGIFHKRINACVVGVVQHVHRRG